MQEPGGYKMPFLGRGVAQGMVNVFAKSAKFYWRMWGPLGEPMVRATEEWANTQRRYLGSLRETRRAEDREEPQAGTASRPEARAHVEEPPMEDYDSLSIHQVTQKLRELSVEEIERLRDYETRNKNRRSLMQRFDTRIEAAREGRSGS